MFWSIQAADRAAHDDFWYQSISGGSQTSSGIRVTSESSLALPAVYSCVRVLAEAIMQVPLILYRRTIKGGKERATDHPLYALLSTAPNEMQTAAEWREIMMHHILLRGNAYARIHRLGHRPVRIGEPIHPDLVTPERGIDPVTGTPIIQFKVIEGGNTIKLPSLDMLHIRGPGVSSDGITGLNPIALERDAIGSGLAAQNFTGRFFANDAQPGGYIEHPSNFKTDEQRDNFRKSWQQAHGGRNQRKMAVLEYGMKYHPTEIKLVDAQFLEQRKYTNLDVARIFRVPPHLIMELERATFSNITQQDVEFVKFSLLPWFVRWEKRLSMSMLSEFEQKQYFFEFLVDGLERGDGESRSKYYKAGIQDGWLTRNEVRKRENLEPLPGLDEPLEPMNMRNPGGANDERLDAMSPGRAEDLKEGAAKAFARKQRQMFMAMNDRLTPEVILDQADVVSQFMKCDASSAQDYCNATAQLLPDDLQSKLEWDLWENRAVRLLMELT